MENIKSINYINGDKYTGDLINNKKEGNGTYTYKN